MARKKRPVHFDIPRDDQGHFLPKELWTKKEIKEYDRLKREGLLANPMRKTKIKGTKKSKDLYVQPQKDGTFLPKDKWTEKEKKLAKKAQKEGLTIAAQLPRDEKGRFVSPTGKKSKKRKKKDQQQMVPVEYPAGPMVSARPGDVSGMHQGNVTVVYPPYPPPPAPPAPPAPPVSYIPFPVMQSAPEQLPPLRRRAAAVQLPAEIEREEEFVERDESVMIPTTEPGLLDEPYILVLDDKLCEVDPTTGEVTVCQDISEIKKEAAKIPKEDLEKALERRISELSSIKSIVGRRDVEKNPRSSYPMYYVKPTFGERVGNTLSNLAKSPLLALIAVGAIAAIGYALYRAIKAFQYRALASVGVEIVGNTIYFPGEAPYVITDEDKLWLARSIWGEVNRDPAAWTRSDVQRGGAAVLWAYANHYMTVGAKRNLYSTLGGFVQGYSQPINPRWDSATDERCQQSPEMCTPDRLAFRNSLRAMPWTSFPPALQNLVISFAAGQVPNPVGTRTDFRAAGTGYNPADPLNLEGNVFGTASNARRRPVEQVA